MHMHQSTRPSSSSANGLSSGWRQTIIWTIDGLMSTGHLEINFSKILIKIHVLYSYTKMNLKMVSAKWQPFIFRPWTDYFSYPIWLKKPYVTVLCGQKGMVEAWLNQFLWNCLYHSTPYVSSHCGSILQHFPETGDSQCHCWSGTKGQIKSIG